jgi:hypothetical protein
MKIIIAHSPREIGADGLGLLGKGIPCVYMVCVYIYIYIYIEEALASAGHRQWAAAGSRRAVARAHLRLGISAALDFLSNALCQSTLVTAQLRHRTRGNKPWRG